MSVKLTTEYKDHDISFDGCSYSITHNGVEVSSRCKSLESCVAFVDKRLKVKYKPVEVLVPELWSDRLVKAKATSLTEGLSGNVICTFLEGKYINERRHFNSTEVYTLSEENLETFKVMSEVENKLTEIESQRNKLVNKRKELRRNLEKFDVSQLVVGE